MNIPFIRQDLKIIKGSIKEDGSPSWLLYDSLRNKYFSLTKTTFLLMKNWVGGEHIDKLFEKIKNLNLNVSKNEIENFINFLDTNNLIILGSGQSTKNLLLQKNAQKKHWIVKLVHNYLFFKIPLFRPDNFLLRTLGFVKILGSRFVRNLIYLLGIIGIFIVFQDYEKFWNTFSYFFNLNGLMIFGFTIIFVKAIHELGHAYVAKNLGCKVSSIGLAMLVFFPFLYTDTTDAWKLRDHRQRLLINFAGMLTEIHLALIATFIWGISPEGLVKSASFFIATSSWISSLLINISPFMRFDGYYVLSDFLKADNLQPRSFEMGRWQIREWIFGFKFNPPEDLERSRKWTFILYAWATWIYRFFIFIGIALLVYYFAFKVLGIILFIIEIMWFIILPIYREIKEWWKLKKSISLNIPFIRSIIIFSFIVFVLFYPWRSSILLPAVYDSRQVVNIFPKEDSFIDQLYISHNQNIKVNQNLVSLISPKIENQIKQSKDRIDFINLRLKRRLGLKYDMDDLMILENELNKEIKVYEGLNEKKENLFIKSPIKGQVSDLFNIKSDQWVSKNNKLFSIINFEEHKVVGFVKENDLNKINQDADAIFIPKNNEFESVEINLTMIDESAVEFLPYLSLSSIFNGDIPSREVDKVNNLHKPEKAMYKVTFIPKLQLDNFQWQTTGSVRLSSKPHSFFEDAYNYISSLFIKESGF